MMDLVKKNMVSVICAVVALIAIGASFYPVQGYFEELKSTATARAAVYSELDGLLNKSRSWPTVSLEEGVPAVQLDMFPTEKVYERGKQIADQIKAESDQMYQTLVEFNKRPQLVDGALPAGGFSLANQFKDRYRRSIEVYKPENRASSHLVQMMKGGFRPTPTQEEAEREAIKTDVYKRAVTEPGNPRNIVNKDILEEEIKQKQALVKSSLRNAVATSSLVYLMESPFDPVLSITGNNSTPDLADMWHAQVSMWVHEDLVRSIAEANQGATNVKDAPVKVLQRIKVTAVPAFKPAPANAQVPAAGPADPSAADFPVNHRSSFTGRIASNLYDVVPFTLEVVVDGTQVQWVLQSLARNKLLTITQCSMTYEDPSLMEASGFYVGDSPLVKLTMTGEMLLLREWTRPLMPPAIRRGLGLPETDAAAAPAP